MPRKVQLGATLTGGRSAGSLRGGQKCRHRKFGRVELLLGNDTSMVFVTAGMGGGTGTGAAPIIAQACKERGILTVGIVDRPLQFEGRRRNQQASDGLEAMREAVDTCVHHSQRQIARVVWQPNHPQRLRQCRPNSLHSRQRHRRGHHVDREINVDMNDVNTVMRDSGRASWDLAVSGWTRSSSKSRERRPRKPASQRQRHHEQTLCC